MNRLQLNRFVSFLMMTAACSVYSQSLADTNKIFIKKISNLAPDNYNFSDVTTKLDRSSFSNYLIRVEIGIPASSKISLRVMDSTGVEIVYLLREKILAPGSFYIKWEMKNFPEGRYWCEFNTPDFIYRKDFYIYNTMK